MLLTPVPVDVSSGLVLEKSFLNVRRVSPLIQYRVGLGGEVLLSENFSRVAELSLVYLPNAKANGVLEGLVTLGSQFGLQIKSKSQPKYIGIASECRIKERPEIDVTQQRGFEDFKWTIIMTDFIQKFIGG